MTNEEAINILKQRQCCMECVADCKCEDCDKAFDMGIEALEKLDKIEKIINSDMGDKYAYDEILEVLEGE